MNFFGLTQTRRNWIAGITLFVATMALYWPATVFPFVNYDDQLYVYENPDVLKGLSWAGIKYAFTAIVAANWHPLTILSLMTDSSVYHSFAGGYHLTNILLHAINVVLLWILMWRLSGLFWPAVLVAALFAVHPLNVQSVAWISERKNVLSTLFFILTVLAYLRYAERPRTAAYILALIVFALGLMAKPMLVTLPFLLLLLDYWPLKRIFPGQNSPKPAIQNIQLLLLEKIPFLMLAVADCIVTYLAQKNAGSLTSLEGMPVTWRLVNIPIAYITYLEKTFWPTNLCILYSFPEKLPILPAMISLALLVIGTVAACYWGWKYRWLAVGWFWFLGTLVPVIGAVQTGAQAWADRHAYVPLIGLFLIIGCGLNELWISKRSSHLFIVLVSASFICSYAVVARQQIGYWRSSIALFSQAIAVDPNNAPAQDLLGTALNGEEHFSDAVEHFAAAVRLQPQNFEYQYNLGRALIDDGRFAEAEGPLAAALKQNPNDAILRNTLGVALMQTGKTHEAQNEFSQAIELKPGYPKSYFNLGKALLKEGQPQPAITNFMTALKLEPNWAEAMENLASAYAADGDLTNAISTASLALALAQTNHQTGLSQQISMELSAYQSAAPQKLSP